MDSIEVVEKQFFVPKIENVDKTKANTANTKNDMKGKVGKLYSNIKRRCIECFEDDEVQEYLRKTIAFLKNNPILACALFAVLVAIAIPIVIFILFVTANVAFVIAGFIILEVTIFIIGATVMSCSIFFVISTAAIIGLSVLSFYLIFCYLVTLLKKRKP